MEEAAASFKQALELDPRSASTALDAGIVYQLLRRHQEADRYYDRSISILPDQTAAYGGKAQNLWSWQGNAAAARGVLERMPEHQSTSAVAAWTTNEMAMRDFASALRRLEAAPFEFFDTSTIAVFPKSMRKGRVLGLMGRREESLAAYREALPHLERYVGEAPDDPFSHSGLAQVLTGLKRHDEAIREIERAAEMLPLERDAMYAPFIIETRARIYTNAGRSEAAIDDLQTLLSIPFSTTVTSLRLHPDWEPLRDHPRFQALIER